VTATDAHGMAISETFHIQVGDKGPTSTVIANQTAYEGQAYSLNVSSHFVAPAAGDALLFSGSMPTGVCTETLNPTIAVMKSAQDGA
jgi:hypothetical protein